MRADENVSSGDSDKTRPDTVQEELQNIEAAIARLFSLQPTIHRGLKDISETGGRAAENIFPLGMCLAVLIRFGLNVSRDILPLWLRRFGHETTQAAIRMRRLIGHRGPVAHGMYTLGEAALEMEQLLSRPILMNIVDNLKSGVLV